MSKHLPCGASRPSHVWIWTDFALPIAERALETWDSKLLAATRWYQSAISEFVSSKRHLLARLTELLSIKIWHMMLANGAAWHRNIHLRFCVSGSDLDSLRAGPWTCGSSNILGLVVAIHDLNMIFWTYILLLNIIIITFELLFYISSEGLELSNKPLINETKKI